MHLLLFEIFTANIVLTRNINSLIVRCHIHIKLSVDEKYNCVLTRIFLWACFILTQIARQTCAKFYIMLSKNRLLCVHYLIVIQTIVYDSLPYKAPAYAHCWIVILYELKKKYTKMFLRIFTPNWLQIVALITGKLRFRTWN